MVYDIPDSAYTGTSGRYSVSGFVVLGLAERLTVQVLHQFAADTPYVVYMSDANGDGTGESPIDPPSFGNLLTL